MKQPSLFVSHGAPTLLLQDEQPAHRFLRDLGQRLPRPDAVLCISAHWESRNPMLGSAEQPAQIHDFYGFPQPLYDFQYHPPGAPGVADQAAELLRKAGFETGLHPSRGLDHGAWVPAALMWPEADVPVTQLSVLPHEEAETHWRMGEALRPLREQGVLILGSGGATHNLRAFRGQDVDAPTPDYVRAFDDWLEQTVRRYEDVPIKAYLHEAPCALHNHPTAEHFLPLVVAMAAGGGPGRRIHHSTTYGVLSMAAFAWGEAFVG